MIHLTIQQLSSHFDGELSEASSGLVREHLTSCETCGSKYAKIEAQGLALAKALLDEPDEALLDRILHAVENRIRPQGPASQPIAPAAAPPRASAAPLIAAAQRAPAAAATVPPRSMPNTPAPVPPRATPALPGGLPTGPSPAFTLRTPSAPPPPSHRPPHAAPTLPPPRARSSFSWGAVIVVLTILASAGAMMTASKAANSWLQKMGHHDADAQTPPAATLPPRSEVAAPESSWAPDTAAGVAPMVMRAVDVEAPPAPARPAAREPKPAPARDASAQRKPAIEVSVPDPAPEPVPAHSAGGLGGAAADSASGAGASFAHLDALASSAVRSAQASEQAATAQPSADSYDAVASEWERALPLLRGDACREARFHSVEARYMAWQLDPNSDRATKTVSAIRAFLVVAPPGPEREGATGWLLDLDDAGYR